LARNNFRVNAIAPNRVATTMIVENRALYEVFEKRVERRLIVR
jgi:NAD(P)-dependent dehydrogenase (short-subunit alcohol dehydrogenase family)